MKMHSLQTSSGCMVLVDVSVARSTHHLLCAKDRFVYQYSKLYPSSKGSSGEEERILNHGLI